MNACRSVAEAAFSIVDPISVSDTCSPVALDMTAATDIVRVDESSEKVNANYYTLQPCYQ